MTNFNDKNCVETNFLIRHQILGNVSDQFKHQFIVEIILVTNLKTNYNSSELF